MTLIHQLATPVGTLLLLACAEHGARHPHGSLLAQGCLITREDGQPREYAASLFVDGYVSLSAPRFSSGTPALEQGLGEQVQDTVWPEFYLLPGWQGVSASSGTFQIPAGTLILNDDHVALRITHTASRACVTWAVREGQLTNVTMRRGYGPPSPPRASQVKACLTASLKGEETPLSDLLGLYLSYRHLARRHLRAA